MIPISLTIKGLFSYQQEQTIHFDRLIEGQLFGIFGAVGSGKSSILEAIAFALYGETERLNTRDDRNYNMMNLKSDELLIDFVFSNFDEKRYRFVVKGKRHGKKFEKVNTFDRSAYIDKGATWEPLAGTTAESLLGLSYENFRRTIIIPQGKFQEFLQLTDKARTDMLKDIFQLDRFEFFQQTASLERKNSEIMQRLNGRLSVFEHVSEAHIDSAGKELQLMADEISALIVELERKENDLKEQESLKRLFEELKTAEELYSRLTSRSEEFQALKQRLSDYEYCERHFKANLQRAEELALGIARRNESLKDYQHKLKICETSLMELQQEFANVIQQYQALEQLNRQRSDYRTALQLLQLRGETIRLRERIVKGKVFVEKAQQEKDHRERTNLALREKLKEKRSGKPDFTVLSEVKNWFSSLTLLEKNRQASRLALDEINEHLKEVEDSLTDLANGAGAIKGNPEESLNQQLAAIDSELEKLSNEMASMKMQIKLGDYVAALHRGEPCPLCGSSTHPQILVLEDVENHLQELNDRYEGLKHNKNAVRERLRQLELWDVKRLSVVKNRDEAQVRYEADDEAMRKHFNSFSWDPLYSKDDIGAIDQSLMAHKKTEEEIVLLEEEIAENEQLLKKAEADRNQYERVIQQIIGEERAKTGALDLLVRQLQDMSEEEVYTYDASALEEHLAKIDSEYNGIIESYERLQKQVQEKQQLQVALETRLQAVNESISAEQERLLFVEQQLQQALEQSKFGALAEVKALLGLAIAVEEVRTDVEHFFQQLYNAKAQYSKLSATAKDKYYEEQLFLKASNLCQAVKEQLNQKKEEYATAKANYDGLLRQLDEKRKLQQALQQVRQRADNLSVLKNLFKGSGFVSYISTIYLQQLCEAANKRFYKLTQQQLRLEVTERNEFQVRDYLNDGKTRLAKTLSGGQTFQASLSLALALAESVQQQNRAKQNFFFLDEGFGSLDKESLSVAFDTLKTLRNENRIVGIISHVEELQQEIDVYLSIKNDPFVGTKVRGSWE
ncbi:SbcC/MukB-like Walker B domain-containing protein [Olivibacter sp. XZL3]|uniref:AAA family ATPase n=1 Tax=Olivibacter sp. XZL3 TaxID=1735116 RepID=UPI001064C3EB|nr:SbcC/MukB-like Walker B domain-containing protein [Olivibacter sp. XZL3]